MSRDRLERSRGRDLELEASPEGYAAACQAALREGDPARARDYLSGALEAFPTAPELLEVAAALSPQDPWPCQDGGDGLRASVYPGPDRGIQSWRQEMFRIPTGYECCVDAEGGAWVRSGQHLCRADRAGITTALEVPEDDFRGFALEAGRPQWYDPHLGALSETPGWRYRRAPGGELVAWSADHLEGTGGGELGWRRRLSNVWRLALGHQALLVLYSPAGSISGIELQVLSLETGAPLGPSRSFTADFQAHWYRVAAVPGESGDRFLIATGVSVGLYESDLRPVWQLPSPKVKFACDGRQVALAGEGGLQVLDLETGRTRWSLPALDVFQAPTFDGRGWVYVISKGSLLSFDRAGERRMRIALGAYGPLGTPALGPGCLYLSAGNSVLCVR